MAASGPLRDGPSSDRVRYDSPVALLLWSEGFVDGLSLDASGHLALAVRDVEAPTASMRLFDTRTRAAAGPEIRLTDGFDGFGCLAETPKGTVAVDIALDRIRLWDPRRGTLLTELASHLPFIQVMAADTRTVDGLTMLVLHGKTDRSMCQWQAYDLHTGQRLPTGDAPDPTYFLDESRIRTVGDDLVVVTAQNKVLADIDVWDVNVARVYRLLDGTRGGEVELSGSGANFTTAVIDGTPLLAVTGHPTGVYVLPSLRLVAELEGADGSVALGTIDGQRVAIAETRTPGELGIWSVDRPGPRIATVAAPFPKPIQLALCPNGTLLAGTVNGLWALPGQDLTLPPR